MLSDVQILLVDRKTPMTRQTNRWKPPIMSIFTP